MGNYKLEYTYDGKKYVVTDDKGDVKYEFEADSPEEAEKIFKSLDESVYNIDRDEMIARLSNYAKDHKDNVDKWLNNCGVTSLKDLTLDQLEKVYTLMSMNDMKLDEETKSNGIYSLFSGWIKEPVKDNIPDNIDLEPELSQLVDKAETCNTIEEIDNFIDDIYKLRQESLLTDGEYGKGNQIFKAIRSKGILHDLKVKKTALETKEMSLEESSEDDEFNVWVQGMADNFDDYDDDLDLFRQPNGLIKFEATVDSLAGFGDDIIYQKEVASKDEVIKDLEEQGWNLDALSIYPVQEFTSSDEWAKQFESLNEDGETDYKQKFVNFCRGKIVDDLGQVNISKFEDEEELRNVDMIGDVREFDQVRMTSNEDYEGLVCVDQNGEIVIDTLMVDEFVIVSRYGFDKISREFYNNVLEYWDDANMDFYFSEEDEEVSESLVTEVISDNTEKDSNNINSNIVNEELHTNQLHEDDIESMLYNKWKNKETESIVDESARFDLQEDEGKLRRLETYRKFANLKEGDEITEENLDEKALRSTSCRHSFDYNDLKDELLGR